MNTQPCRDSHGAHHRVVVASMATLMFACAMVAAQPRAAREAAALVLSATIPLPNVAGRIDHLAYDPARQRLFVAALGNDTVEVVDTALAVHLQSVRGFHEPQGVAVVSDLGAVAVANGGTGTLQLIDTATLHTRWTTTIASDADNVRYDLSTRRLYVAAAGGLFQVAPDNGAITARTAVAGHPESFQLDGPSRIIANLPGASRIVALDTPAHTVRDQWDTAGCRSNYPLAIDERTQRAFVGCRQPPSVAVLDITTGRVVSTATTVGDTDDLFYDAATARLYVIGGEGAIDVFSRQGDQLVRLGRIPTRDGARTGLWVAAQRRLYVAVPSRRGAAAEVRVYAAPE